MSTHDTTQAKTLVLQTLALLDLPLTSASLAAGTGLPQTQVHAVLEELLDDRDVEQEHDNRYGRIDNSDRPRLPKLAPAAATAILHRLVEHYSSLCIAADTACRPTQKKFGAGYPGGAEFRGRGDALMWFSQERSAILAVLRQAVETSGFTSAWQLAEPLWLLLQLLGQHAQALESQQIAEFAARKDGHPFEAVALIRQGHAQRHLGQYQAAVDCCTRALQLAEERTTAWGKESCLWITSVALENRMRAFADAPAGALNTGSHQSPLERALADALRSCEIESFLQDTVAADHDHGYGMALRLGGLADIHARRGDHSEALRTIAQAEHGMRTIHAVTGDPAPLARMIHLRGAIQARLGHPADTLSALHEAGQLLTDWPPRWQAERDQLTADAHAALEQAADDAGTADAT